MRVSSTSLFTIRTTIVNSRCRGASIKKDKSESYESIRTVSSMDLGINLDSAILRDKLIGYRNTFVDRNALFDNSVMFHTIHGCQEISTRIEWRLGTHFDILSIRSIFLMPSQCRIC